VVQGTLLSNRDQQKTDSLANGKMAEVRQLAKFCTTWASREFDKRIKAAT
jgi:hypothetical protein